MSDQENQEMQDSGQIVAEVEQEAATTSETTAVDQNVQASEDSAPAHEPTLMGSDQPGEDPQAVGEAPAPEPPTAEPLAGEPATAEPPAAEPLAAEPATAEPPAGEPPAGEPATAPAAQGSQD